MSINFKSIYNNWIQNEKWQEKETKPLTECGINVDTILVMEGEWGNVGLIAFYLKGCRYPQYVSIPFSAGIEPLLPGILPKEEIEDVNVLTLEKYGECIYRLTINK